MRALALIALLVLAGCAAPAPAATDDSDGTLAVDDIQAGFGAISGVVVDVAIRPIADATVRIAGREALTDGNGNFVFNDIAPGNYDLNASAVGYDPVRTNVNVIEGEIAHPRLQLTPVPVIEPLANTLKFKGYITASLGPAGAIGNAALVIFTGSDPTCDCSMEFETVGDVRTIIMEATWTPSLNNPIAEDDLFWSFYPKDPHDEFAETKGGAAKDPFLVRFPIEDFDDADHGHSTWVAGLAGSVQWVNIQQEYEMFITYFTNAPAPEGWSLVSGSE